MSFKIYLLLFIIILSEVLIAAPQSFFYKVNFGNDNFSNLEKDSSKADLIKRFYTTNPFQCTSNILINMKKMMNNIRQVPEFIQMMSLAGLNISSIKLGLEQYCLDSSTKKDQKFISINLSEDSQKERLTCSQFILEPVLYEFPEDEDPIRISRLLHVKYQSGLLKVKSRRTGEVIYNGPHFGNEILMKSSNNYCNDLFFSEKDFQFLLQDGLRNYVRVREKILLERKIMNDKSQKYSCLENPYYCK